MDHIIARGSSKSISNYFANLERIYNDGKISYEDYIGIIGAARTLLLKEDEEEVLKWMREMLGE